MIYRSCEFTCFEPAVHLTSSKLQIVWLSSQSNCNHTNSKRNLLSILSSDPLATPEIIMNLLCFYFLRPIHMVAMVHTVFLGKTEAWITSKGLLGIWCRSSWLQSSCFQGQLGCQMCGLTRTGSKMMAAQAWMLREEWPQGFVNWWPFSSWGLLCLQESENP